jgi:serine/threonine-protein kinase
LLRRGQTEEARAAWQAALEFDPPEHKDWYGYAEFCLFLGREDEYRRARRALLARFATTTAHNTAERVSRACLLLPAEGDDLRRAVALTERAAAVDRSKEPALYPYFQFVRGLAYYRQEQFGPAITVMRGDAARVLGPAPGLVLAMALYQSGQTGPARKALATAVAGYDWTPANVHGQNEWIFHVLRREAERTILPNLPDFLDGKYQPKDNDERLALTGVCQFLERHRAAAGLSATVFASDPQWNDGRNVTHRYLAARSAALAGCGRGTDAAGADKTERARWRKCALEWLRADLAAWVRILEIDPARREAARKVLTYWQSHADLACVRDPDELDKLDPDERKEFVALWADVTALLARTK